MLIVVYIHRYMEAGGLLIKKGNEIRYVLSCHGKYSAGCTSIEYIIIDLTNLSGKPPVYASYQWRNRQHCSITIGSSSGILPLRGRSAYETVVLDWHRN